MNRPRYLSGEPIHAGDQIVFQDRGARVLFIKNVDGFSEYAAGGDPRDWDFMSDEVIYLEFDDGDGGGFKGFCAHDDITLTSRQQPTD